MRTSRKLLQAGLIVVVGLAGCAGDEPDGPAKHSVASGPQAETAEMPRAEATHTEREPKKSTSGSRRRDSTRSQKASRRTPAERQLARLAHQLAGSQARQRSAPRTSDPATRRLVALATGTLNRARKRPSERSKPSRAVRRLMEMVESGELGP